MNEYTVDESGGGIYYSFGSGVGSGPLLDRSYRGVITDGKTGNALIVDLDEDEKEEIRTAYGRSHHELTNKWLQIMARHHGTPKNES